MNDHPLAGMPRRTERPGRGSLRLTEALPVPAADAASTATLRVRKRQCSWVGFGVAPGRTREVPDPAGLRIPRVWRSDPHECLQLRWR
jgi:hypothetical protein